ncbi:MAG TPA: hypothetical protein VL989_02105 [Candidatus Sulfotelmatobacter sp.]|nr:hypothetical protein [Candidatus Sulfotelmatobacter sp.]
MKLKNTDQNGFIPMLICLALIMLVVIYIAYKRVLHHHLGP